MKTRVFVSAFLLVVGSFLPNWSVHASMINYGVYKVEARITGDDLHQGMTQIDSKTPGIGSTDANAFVSDSYGSVSNSWSICPLTANEAQVNVAMAYNVLGSSYANSYAGETSEIHFNYHSDTPFTVNYYWDLTWDLYPYGYLEFNSFAQSVRLRIYDSMNNWVDYWGPTSGSKYYGLHGRYIGSTAIRLGAGDWLFIVFDVGSPPRYGGEWESLSGNVYLDFDGGVDYNHDGSVNLVDYSFFAQTWLLSSGQAGYLEICDLVNDDVIDLNDLLIFLESWLD